MVKLKNGLRIAYKKTKEKAVYLELLVKAGSGHEEPTAKGVAHYLEHVKFNTKKYGEAENVFRLAKENSIQLNAYTYKRETNYNIKTLPESIDLALDLLKQIVFHSDLTESYIEKERGIIQNEIARRPEYIKDYNLNSKVYDGLFADNVIALPEQVAGLTFKNIIDFQEKYYVPNNMCLIIAGPCGKQKELMEKIKPLFEEYEFKKIKKTKRNKLKKENHIEFNEKEDQTYKINIAAIVSEKENDLKQRIIYNISAKCITEKLNDYFREELSMVYNIRAGMEKLEKQYVLQIRTDLQGKEVIEDFLAKFESYKTKINLLITEELIQRNVKSAIAEKKFKEDNSETFIDDTIVYEIENTKFSTEKEYLETIGKISMTEIKETIEEMLKQEMYTVVVN